MRKTKKKQAKVIKEIIWAKTVRAMNLNEYLIMTLAQKHTVAPYVSKYEERKFEWTKLEDDNWELTRIK